MISVAAMGFQSVRKACAPHAYRLSRSATPTFPEPTAMRFVLLLMCLSVMLSGAFAPVDVLAQTPDLPAAEAYVPAMGVGAAIIRPQSFINYPDYSPELKMFPVEVVEAWGKQNLGINPLTLAEIKLILGMPIGAGPPPFGIVLTFLDDFHPEKIAPDLLVDGGPTTVDGRKLYPLAIPDAPVELMLESVGPKTCLIADPLMLETMRLSEKGTGPLADLLTSNAIGRANIQVAVAVYPLRPLIAQVANNPPEDLPAELKELIRGIVLINSVIIRSKIDGDATITRLEVLGDDAAGAAKLHRLAEQVLELAKAQVKSTIAKLPEQMEPGPVTDALVVYLNRISQEMFAAYQPKLSNDRVVVDAKANLSIATIGVLTGLLLPAVQAAREAARRMSSSNNLKQIALAMHNYHDTFRSLPAAAITSPDGEPLLSWRVAILPFIEEQALYERFRKDEPWDSPHNIALLEEMPAIYATSSNRLMPGHTAYHAAIGEELMFRPTGKTRFQDVVDGLSNTLMVMEGNASSQVPWTAPDHLEIDDADPLASFRSARPGGFNAAFGDGSVRFIVDTIDIDIFRALLTRAGLEQVSLP
jgi:prepilin-type processing-associated H-X9-DG protein